MAALVRQPDPQAVDSAGFEPGGVYSLRVGLSDERGHAIVSAMVAVRDRGNEVLWSSPEAAR